MKYMVIVAIYTATCAMLHLRRADDVSMQDSSARKTKAKLLMRPDIVQTGPDTPFLQAHSIQFSFPHTPGIISSSSFSYSYSSSSSSPSAASPPTRMISVVVVDGGTGVLTPQSSNG